jgi:hypothetical protein
MKSHGIDTSWKTADTHLLLSCSTVEMMACHQGAPYPIESHIQRLPQGFVEAQSHAIVLKHDPYLTRPF